MKLYKAVYKPRQWFTLRTAKTDGTPIILRHPEWTHDIVVTWGNLAAYGIESEDEEGWLWENIAIEKQEGAEPFDLAQVENTDMTKATWSHFGITAQAWQQLENERRAHCAH